MKRVAIVLGLAILVASGAWGVHHWATAPTLASQAALYRKTPNGPERAAINTWRMKEGYTDREWLDALERARNQERAAAR